MLHARRLKEGGQIPNYRIPIFPVFRYIDIYADTEAVFFRDSVSRTDSGFPIFSVRFGIGIHHWCDTRAGSLLIFVALHALPIYMQ